MSDEWTKARDEAAWSHETDVRVCDCCEGTFKAGAEFGRAYERKRTANLERDFETESEAHTFYKREWEYACDRYNSLKLDHDELKARAEKLVEALKGLGDFNFYADPNFDNPSVSSEKIHAYGSCEVVSKLNKCRAALMEYEGNE